MVILKTLEVLEERNRHVQFLFEMAEHLENTLLYQDYLVIWLRCCQFFQQKSEPQLSELFIKIKGYQEAHKK